MNMILILILVAILSIGGYIILEQNNISNSNLVNVPQVPIAKNITIAKIVIPKDSIEFTLLKNKENEYMFSGIFSEEDTPKILVKSLNLDKLTHDININSELEYDKDVIVLGKKLFKELVDNYVEGSIIYKKRKLLIKGSVKDKKNIESVDSILEHSIINSFNATELYSEALPSSDISDETADIISNLVRTVDNGEDTIAELVKPKIIIKEKIVIKYKEPIIKEKTVIKYVKIPAENSQNDMTSSITKEECMQKLNSKGPDKNLMELPFVEMVDMNIEDKIKKGALKPLRTKKPLVERERRYIPLTQKKIDKKIPWANLYEMDAELDGIIYDDVVAAPR